ncbi:MAG: bacillithiol biosynthesis cysteine-adding enzyme BshC [Ferruginibacter sp.]|nr:bacillithiol biosynthesis cysteine-adding enzyme BshC [Ferruginibacter sp.]
MNTSTQIISYASTNSFSKIVTDYIDGNSALLPFYKHPISIDGIKNAIDSRQAFKTNRKLLTEVLQQQYSSIELTPIQKNNLALLEQENCFTITTAHQPNIFTGPLYFIYKILHAIKLATYCAAQLPQYNFVPVYYMGSEDADLEELNHIHINGEKYEWQTKQTGAVGRMKVDDNLLKLIDSIGGQLLVQPYGNEIISALKNAYQLNSTIEQATFNFVNYLFSQYGLIILLPDNKLLKQSFATVIKKELQEQFSHKAVAETVEALPTQYKVQASGRDLNLFYLRENKRERIEKVNAEWLVVNSTIRFNEEELWDELKNYPERFSPNVILRPVFQETILPNVAFIGGGGELAYWLELKKVFEAVNVPYPVLVLRNSFLLMDEQQQLLAAKLELSSVDLFTTTTDLLTNLVKRESDKQLQLQAEKQALQKVYDDIKKVISTIDTSLLKHTDALHTKAANKLTVLEKKMLKAEKKKFEAQKRQIEKIKKELFPKNNLQERVESILPFYAKWGSGFIDVLHKYSLNMEQQFCILK